MAVDNKVTQHFNKCNVSCIVIKLRKRSRSDHSRRPKGVISNISVQSATGPSLSVPYIVYGLFYSRYFIFYYFRLAN